MKPGTLIKIKADKQVVAWKSSCQEITSKNVFQINDEILMFVRNLGEGTWNGRFLYEFLLGETLIIVQSNPNWFENA